MAVSCQFFFFFFFFLSNIYFVDMKDYTFNYNYRPVKKFNQLFPITFIVFQGELVSLLVTINTKLLCHCYTLQT